MALTVLVIIAAIIEVAGFIVSPFWLYPVFQIVPTVMFMARRIGVVTPMSKVRNVDITGFVLITALAWFLGKLSWSILWVLLLRIIFLLIVWYDDKTFLYIEEDM